MGVKLHDEWVRILLYADDGALVATVIKGGPTEYVKCVKGVLCYVAFIREYR